MRSPRSSAVFILDALDPLTDDELQAAADALTQGLLALSPEAVVHRRLIAPAAAHSAAAHSEDPSR